jgi:hypothetical protein
MPTTASKKKEQTPPPILNQQQQPTTQHQRTKALPSYVALSADDDAGAVSRQWGLLRSAFMRRDACLLFHLKVSLGHKGGGSLIRHSLILCHKSLPRLLLQITAAAAAAATVAVAAAISAAVLLLSHYRVCAFLFRRPRYSLEAPLYLFYF